MSRIDELITEMCPGGVEYRALCSLVSKPAVIRWPDQADATFEYIDLTSVERLTHRIRNTLAINRNSAPSRAQQVVNTGDVIFGTTRPTLRRYAAIGQEHDRQICSTGFCVLRPNNDVVLTNYLFHLLGTSQFSDYVEANQRGASYPAIADGVVKRFRAPIPPLVVQREIARILDTFTELEAERRQYEYYRDELLTFADDKARWVKLDQLATFKYGYTATASLEGDYRFIRITDITEGGKLSAAERRYVDAADGTNDYLVKAGDVLMARTGATFGKTVLVTEPIPAVYASFLIRISLDSSKVLPGYYWHFAQSDVYWQQAHRLVGKGGQPQFNANAVKEIRFPLPPLEEQARIVTILDKFDALVTDLSVGLPAELKARRQQYEYYRDRLLTFTEAA